MIQSLEVVVKQVLCVLYYGRSCELQWPTYVYFEIWGTAYAWGQEMAMEAAINLQRIARPLSCPPAIKGWNIRLHEQIVYDNDHFRLWGSRP